MSELSYEASDEASENELLERSLSVWRGWSSIREDFTPIPLDIHTASSIGQFECVRALIQRGVEVDRKNIGGWTPLMYACYIGHDPIVSLLIDNGCNVNLKNQRGQTPLMLAASCGNESVGRFLLRKGAELEAADRNGWTALFHATYSGHQNFVSFLLDQRANMDAVEPTTGLTPFMEAAIEGHEIIVQLFLQHGVNVNAKAYNGDTARTLALMYSYMKIVSLIDNHVMPHSSLRSEPGLGDYLSSSDEVDKRQRPQHQRGSRAKSKAGPSIRDGPEAIARMIDRTRTSDHIRYPRRCVSALESYSGYTTPIRPFTGGGFLMEASKSTHNPYVSVSPEVRAVLSIFTGASSLACGLLLIKWGYMSFPRGEGEQAETLLSYRDVTSPINQEDYHLDSSGGKDSCDYNDDSNAFSKTGAITIKSSSSSSGGLIAALGLSRQNSADSDEFVLHDSGVHNSSQSEDNGNAEPDACTEGEGGEEKLDTDSAKKDSNQQNLVECVKKLSVEDCGEHKEPDQLKELPQESQLSQLASVHSEDSSAQDGVGDTNEVSPVKEGARRHGGPHPESARKSGKEGGVTFAGVFREQHTDGTSPFHIQFGDLVFPNLLGQAAGEGLESPAPALDPSAAPPELYSDNLLLDRNRLFDPTGVGNSEAVAERQTGNMGGCIQFGGAGTPLAPAHLQRRSSCQARLSRLTVADRDCTSQGKEIRHRRRSANSPPSFHREYGGRGQDLGSGTGRVSCLSDIPTNPGPHAGYPITSSTRSSSQLPPIENSDGSARFQGDNPVPVAAVAPTCVPPGYTSLTPHPTSAFVPPLAPQSPHPQQNPTPDASPGTVANPTVPPPGYQSEGPAGGTPTTHNRDMAEFPGSGDGGGSGHCDLAALLDQLGVSKYAALFAEQDVDLQVFLSLTDNDLKEIGIKLFGPRKKMTNAIARWHSQAPAARSSLEQAYADRLEGEMQEMAIQLNQAYDNAEKLKAQVLQERQLRSVTESCLMEERGGWQRVHHSLLDTHQHCRDISEAVNKLSSLHAELKQCLGQTQNNNHLPSTASSPFSDIGSMPTLDQVVHLCDQYLYDLHQHSLALTHNMECIVSNPPATGSIHDSREVHHDFP